MKLTAFEQLGAGGVDSRSNPLAFPPNRALRCLNWVPKQSDFWELRYGYSSVTMSTVTASAIHSMFPYRIWNGSKYVLFMQGTTFKTLDTSTGTVTSPTIAGTAIASSSKGAGYLAANRFHYGNGTDQKWYDATRWRNNGLPALTDTQAQAFTITEGVREFTTTQAVAVAVGVAGGGSFPGDAIGRFIYVAIFDPRSAQYITNEIGPATIPVGTGRIAVPLNDLLAITGLPDLSGVNANWVKLIAGTGDGTTAAFFFTNTSTNINSCSRSGQVLTISATGHGLSVGDVVIIAGNGTFDGVYRMDSNIDANTFTVTVSAFVGSSNSGALGTVKRIIQAGSATTSVNVSAPTQDTSYQVNQNRGLAASTIGGPNPGYQFYASIYNPNGGHVGNRTAIGARFSQTAYRVNLFLTGQPSLSDTEHLLVFGRTVDGGQTPNVCTSPDDEWATTSFYQQSQMLITQGDLDGNHEMPSRNSVIPAACNMFCVAGDFVYAGDTASPYIRRSGDMSQNDERGATFTGRAEQSWAPNDIDTFPTGEALTGMFEVDQEVFCGTLHDTAMSVNLAGIQQWVGPWNIGLAGRRAGTKCGFRGFYWLSGDKQLCTLVNGVPTVVSEEYELAELSQIGDAYLSTVELAYYRNPAQGKDELRIEGQKSDGTPYTIIHDFKLNGQGYSSQFLGALASAFTVSQVRDGNGLQVYAGGSNGQIYQLSSGANDAGTEYVADLILLTAGGVNRPSIPFFDFYGDSNIKVTVGRTLSTSLASGAVYTFDDPSSDADIAETVQGSEQDFLYRVKLTPSEVQKLYLRFKLTSHSADGNLTLNSPPHVPLENYGRLYELIPAIGEGRDR